MEPIYADRFRKLAGFLRASRTYDQSDWSHEHGPHCGAPACIAGHAAFLAGVDMSRELSGPAAEWLGLDRFAADALFTASASAWPEPYCEQFIALCEDKWQERGITEEARLSQAQIAADLCEAIADGRVEL